MILSPICTLTWRVKKYVSLQGKGVDRRNEITLLYSSLFVALNDTLFLR